MKNCSIGGISMHWFEWYNHTIYHKIGGPSTIIGNNVIYEYNGFVFTNTKEYCYVCGFDDETTMLWVIKYGDSLPLTLDKI